MESSYLVSAVVLLCIEPVVVVSTGLNWSWSFILSSDPFELLLGDRDDLSYLQCEFCYRTVASYSRG